MDDICADDLRLSLAEFTNDVFAPLKRAIWRERSEFYLRSLVLGDKRRQRASVTRQVSAPRDQSLNHFVSVSPWDPSPIRRRMSERFLDRVTLDAWVLGHTTFYKYGEMLACVARQHTGVADRVANCQIGISVHLASEDASCPVNWRLFLPESWDPDLVGPKPDLLSLRARTGIPGEARYRRKWEHAVDMIDEMALWGIRPPLVLSDRRLDGSAELARALESRSIPYVVEIDPMTTACTETGSRERRAVRDIVTAEEQIAPQTLGWRQPVRGQDGELRITQSRFIFVHVRDPWFEARRRTADDEAALRWLIVEWPSGSREPTGYWFSDLPASTSLSRLARLTKLRWRVSYDGQTLADDFGLGRYKGRTWAGWHHHVTLASAAHAFRTLQRFERVVPAQLRFRQPSSVRR